MGKLYIISTPIGNLEDITLRAIRVLQEVDIVACEDTRKTGLLMQQIKNNEIEKSQRFISYFEHNEEQRIPEIIGYLKQDLNIALVSNAGTPTLSDPGFKLVRECIAEGIIIEAIPGPSAILTALVSSGLPTDKFFFLGYLPKKSGKKKQLFETASLLLSNKSSINNLTFIFYESQYRLVETLEIMREVLGDIDIVVGRELTKVHEEIRREKISESLKHFGEIKILGEFTVLFNVDLS